MYRTVLPVLCVGCCIMLWSCQCCRSAVLACLYRCSSRCKQNSTELKRLLALLALHLSHCSSALSPSGKHGAQPHRRACGVW